MKKLLIQFMLFIGILGTHTVANAGPWLVGQQTPTYTDAHPLLAHDAGSFYASEPADIASNFTVGTWLHTGGAATGQFDAPGVGSEAKARFDCNIAFENKNDPILAPGVPNGATHDHSFFGNLAAATNTWNVTYASLRASGNSTCYGGPINRTLYWEPSMKVQLPSGVIATIKPKNIVTYYENGALAKIGTGEIDDPLKGSRWPRSLDMIFGFNMSDPTDSRITNIINTLNTAAGWARYGRADSTSGGFAGWQCSVPNAGAGTGGTYGNSPTGGPFQPWLRNSNGTAALDCAPNTEIYAEAVSYPCWDGKNPTSPDGRLHFMPFLRDNNSGKLVCPDNWQKVTQFRVKAAWNSGAGASEYKEWWLSSDRISGGTTFKNGESFHSDLIPAWDYGTAASPGVFLKFQIRCDGITVTISGTTVTGDGHECGYGRISSTEQVWVNEPSPDGSAPNPLVQLNPDQSGAKKYFPLLKGTTGTFTVTHPHHP